MHYSLHWLKILLLTLTLGLLIGYALNGLRVEAYDNRPPTKHTGAPGETTCTSCHRNSVPVNGGSGKLTLTGLPATYLPGQSIPVTIALQQAGYDTFGFQVTVIDDVGRQAGSMVVTDPFRTASSSATVLGNTRQYLGQTTGGLASTGTAQGSWNLTWSAPAESAGRVTFYIAGLACDGGGGSSFDHTYTASFAIQPAAACSYGVAPVSLTVPAEGVTETVSVTAGSGCSWAAVSSNSTWITVTSGSSGSGNGAVLLMVAANSGIARTGTLVIAGQTVTVTQSQATTARLVRVGTIYGTAGGKVRIPVELIAQGDENGASFSLSFDPAWLSSPRLELPPTGQSVTINSSLVTQGRIGLTTQLASGVAFTRGVRLLAAVVFDLSPNAVLGQIPIGFGDQPVARLLIGVAGGALPGNYADGMLRVVNLATCVSSASYRADVLASGSLVTAFGIKLATGAGSAMTLPLPTTLAGTTISIRDSVGVDRLAELIYVAPWQINLYLPDQTAPGTATVTVTAGDGTVSVGQLNVAKIAAGLFTANSTGSGVASGQILRVKADGSQVYQPLAVYDPVQQGYVPIPIDVGLTGETVYAILYGTGFRAAAQGGVTVAITLGGRDVNISYAGTQGEMIGLDQLNLLLSGGALATGEMEVVLTVAGKAANSVRMAIK